MDFGKKPTIKQKMAMAEKRGYDSGKQAEGKKPLPKAKVNPTVKKNAVGVKVTKKL